jgi:predicted ATPase
VIDHLAVRNFKRFEALEMPMTQLNVLTGVNSGGKSSVIQALLLLHSERLSGDAVPLNGPYGLALGEASDVLFVDAQEPQIEISVTCGAETGRLVMDVPGDRSPSLIALVEEVPEALRSARREKRSFVYLSAERLGPRDLQEVAVDFEANLSVGPRGEYTAHVLAQLSRLQVDEPRRHPRTDELGGVITLTSQAEHWMSDIVCPLQIGAQWLAGTSAATVRFKSPHLLTDWLRPSNVGFGISYALPIVVGGLTAAPDGLFIVENPESHLHPAGQSAVGRFLARVASGGTQVIVETHSDHVLDGIRVAIASDRVLDAAATIVNYFGADSAPAQLLIDERGAVSEWPSGFFDQSERDLSELARAKRRW